MIPNCDRKAVFVMDQKIVQFGKSRMSVKVQRSVKKRLNNVTLKGAGGSPTESRILCYFCIRQAELRHAFYRIKKY